MEEIEDNGEISIDIKATSIKDIAMEHFRRITRLSSVELRGGFWMVQKEDNGEKKMVYVEDTREVLSNAILCLAYLIQHKFDKKMEKGFENYKEKYEERKKLFLKATKINDNQVLGEGYYKDGEEKKKLEEFKIEKLLIHQELFEDICLFLGRVPLGISSGILE